MKFIFSISLIIISAVLFFGLVNPLYSSVSSLRTEVATYNIALNNSTDLQKTRDDLVEKYKHIDPKDREKLEHFLPNTVNNIKFILEMERIANLHSMSIKNIKFDTKAKVDTNAFPQNPASQAALNNPQNSLPYGVFPIEFTTEGDYNTFSLFLKDIEHNLRLVDIKSVSFAVPPIPDKASPGPHPNPNIYTYTLKVETYWLK